MHEDGATAEDQASRRASGGSHRGAGPHREDEGAAFTVEWVHPGGEGPPGVSHRTFHSPSMNCDVGFNIYRPPGYDSDDRRYPVIYWLHGAARGGESIGMGHSRILREGILSGQLPPMIMVFPSGGRGTLYYDSADGTIMAETSIIKELIPLIDRDYRTIANRRARAIEGFSMGGFGALKLGFKYPDLFCSVVAGAPALVDWERLVRHAIRRDYHPDFTRRMWGNDRRVFDSDHASAWLRRNADLIRRDMRVRIVVGDQDELKSCIDAFREELVELKIPHEYEVLDGVKHDRVRVYDLAGLKGMQFHATSFAMRPS